MKNQKGFSLIELLVVVIIIAIIAAIAIPSLLASRRSANEASAVGSMRTFHSANFTYMSLQSPNAFAANAVALSNADLIDTGFSAAIDGANDKAGYEWAYTFAAASPVAYSLTATDAAGATGLQKGYFINEEGAIRVGAAGATATATDPVLP